MAKKRVEIKLRLSPEKLGQLNASVKRTGLSREAYLRRLIDGYEPKAMPPLAYFTLMQHVRYASSLLCDIAEAAKVNEDVDAEKYAEAVKRLDSTVEEIHRTVIEPKKMKTTRKK